MTGKPVKKVSKRVQKEQNKERAALVRAALEIGVTTRKQLSEAAGISMHLLNNLFQVDRKLYNEYSVRRKNLSEIAADNIEDIINDPEHPNHYAASKWVLDKYKSDLNKVLEAQDSDEISLKIGEGDKTAPVVISFTKNKKEDGEKKEG